MDSRFPKSLWDFLPPSVLTSFESPHRASHTPVADPQPSFAPNAGAWHEAMSDARAAQAFAQSRQPVVREQASRVPLGLQRAANAELIRLGLDTSRMTLIAGGRVQYQALTTALHNPQINVTVPSGCFAMTYEVGGAHRTVFFRERGGALTYHDGVQHWSRGEDRPLDGGLPRYK